MIYLSGPCVFSVVRELGKLQQKKKCPRLNLTSYLSLTRVFTRDHDDQPQKMYINALNLQYTSAFSVQRISHLPLRNQQVGVHLYLTDRNEVSSGHSLTACLKENHHRHRQVTYPPCYNIEQYFMVSKAKKGKEKRRTCQLSPHPHPLITTLHNDLPTG